jgi:hypothetical protein
MAFSREVVVDWLPDVSWSRSAARENAAAWRPKATTSSLVSLGTATEEYAGDRAGEHEVSNLRDHRNGRKARIHVLAEDPFVLAFFDRGAESFEEPGRKGPDRWFGVGCFPVDQFAGEEDRKVRVGGEDRDLALHDCRDDVFGCGVFAYAA